MNTQSTDQGWIVINGVGTAGSCLAECLVRQGVGKIVLVDHDRVEEHNLSKSALFDRSHLGKYKVLAAEERLKAINPDVDLLSLPCPIEGLRAGIQRLAVVSIACMDNRLAKLNWNRFNLANHTPHALIAELEGGKSLNSRLRAYTPNNAESACLECGWDLQEYAQLNLMNLPCTLPGKTSRSSQPFSPALRLAAETAEEIQRILAGTPGLKAGQELRLLPESHQTMILQTARNPECLAPHEQSTWIEISGEAGDLVVGDFITQVSQRLGSGWTWLLPVLAGWKICGRCGRKVGVRIPGWDLQSTCSACGSTQADPDTVYDLHRLVRSDLEPLENQRLVEVWPPGDILRIQQGSPAGGTQHLALPLNHLAEFWKDLQEAER